MRYVEQIITKRITLYEEFMLNKHYLRAIWMFYQGYVIALIVLGRTDPDYMKKNMLWRRALKKLDAFDSKEFKILKEMIDRDYTVVQEALDYLKSDRGRGEEIFGDHYRKFSIGIMSYEYPEGF